MNNDQSPLRERILDILRENTLSMKLIPEDAATDIEKLMREEMKKLSRWVTNSEYILQGDYWYKLTKDGGKLTEDELLDEYFSNRIINTPHSRK